MKTLKIILISIAIILCDSPLFGQVTNLGNGYLPGRYLGWNTTNGVNPLLLKTNATTRMQIDGNTTTPNPAGFGLPINTSGFVGINTDEPITRLHIRGNSSATNFGGYRPWMQTGVTFCFL